MQIDIEKLLREAGVIYSSGLDGKAISASMNRFDLRIYTALVLEEAEKVCKSKHANGSRKYSHADECADAISYLSRQITEGKS